MDMFCTAMLGKGFTTVVSMTYKTELGFLHIFSAKDGRISVRFFTKK